MKEIEQRKRKSGKFVMPKPANPDGLIRENTDTVWDKDAMDTMEDQMTKHLDNLKVAHQNDVNENDVDSENENEAQNIDPSRRGRHKKNKSHLLRLKSSYNWDTQQLEDQAKDMKQHLAYMLENEAKQGKDGKDVNDSLEGSVNGSSDLSSYMQVFDEDEEQNI